MQLGPLDSDQQVVVVAEIGNNHEGDPAVARELVEHAASAGADAVKLQTFRTEHYVSAHDADRFARLKRFELPVGAWAELAELARARGMLFISTPFDLLSVDVLEPLVDAYKVASGDNLFFPLLQRIANTTAPMIVSTGLSELASVARTVQFVDRIRDTERLAILHCVTSYPTAPAEAQLRAIEVLRERFSCTVGYSDHTIGNDAAVLAVGLGARIIEKHFTLDKQFSDFRDHQLSADPQELASLVVRIREAELLLGSREKSVQPAEQAGTVALRRSIVAGADLAEGHILRSEDLTWIRPGGGLAPGSEHDIVGRRLRRPVPFGERIGAEDVE
jgi:N,N'-diacetyllegionaminate synthase